MNFKKIVGIALCTVQICFAQNIAPVNPASVNAPLSELEKLFESGRYAEFQASANLLADQGDAEAQFLLGKAYHLGKGVKLDPAQAKRFYDLAAAQKNARAEHNLGMMALDLDENPIKALNHFRKAETSGLKIPTLYNLGRTYKILCERSEDAALCESAGDAFFQAWQIKPENDWLDEAAASLARACLLERQGYQFGGLQAVEPVVVGGVRFAKRETERCSKAQELTEKGASLGLARAAFNRGTLETYVKNYEQALPWIRLAYERDLGLAAYQLALFYELGLGVSKDQAAALAMYQRGAVLKNKQSIEYMLAYWGTEVMASFEPARIKAALLEIRSLNTSSGLQTGGTNRLQHIEFIEANRASFPALADLPLNSQFCLEKSLGPNYRAGWRLFGLTEPADMVGTATELNLIAQGTSGDNMCMSLNVKDQKKLKQALVKGQTPMFSWPGQRRLMSVERDSKGVLSLKFAFAVDY